MSIRRKAADPLARHMACIRTGSIVWDGFIIPPEPVVLMPRPDPFVLLVTL